MTIKWKRGAWGDGGDPLVKGGGHGLIDLLCVCVCLYEYKFCVCVYVYYRCGLKKRGGGGIHHHHGEHTAIGRALVKKEGQDRNDIYTRYICIWACLRQKGRHDNLIFVSRMPSGIISKPTPKVAIISSVHRLPMSSLAWFPGFPQGPGTFLYEDSSVRKYIRVVMA